MTHRPLSAAAWFEAGTQHGVRKAGDPHRWQRCIDHHGSHTAEFVRLHFGEDHRRILLLGGAGFDPRSLTVATCLSGAVKGSLVGRFLRERRASANPYQLGRGDHHASRLTALVSDAIVADVNVFEADGAVAVGRTVIDVIKDVDFGRFTDVVIDFSALSIGSSFPLAKFVLQSIERRGVAANVHAMVTAHPQTDDRIVPVPSEKVGPVLGFNGRLGLDETARAARLWMPQLRRGHRAVLERLLDYVDPHDIVPVLPFPSTDPLSGDRLIEHYAAEFESRWGVDARSIVYADEASPLDFYRTVLRIDDGRRHVFESTGQSLLILSPVGSKVLAIGAMMAAVERDLPVVYVEAMGYNTQLEGEEPTYSESDLVHVWLSGREAYPEASTV